MASGLRCWDGSGALQLDATTRMGRIIGEVTTAQDQPGSIDVPAFAQGQGFVLVQRLTDFVNVIGGGGGGTPLRSTVFSQVTLDQAGRRISWTAGDSTRISYGVL